MNSFIWPERLTGPLAFVDIETSGSSARFARVLEVGVIRVEQGLVAKEFQTLLYPGHTVPRWITELTGIKDDDVREAPQFHEVAADLAEVLDGATFVAHNVHFDYGFIKAEFDRLGVPFRPKLLCTVRLSRKLYPSERRHNLESVIARLGIRPARRHRALDDARVLWEFCQRASSEIEAETIDQAVKTLLKTPSIPRQLDPEMIARLPSGPGVYLFKAEDQSVLYVGKSVNIKDRVRSHFAQFHSDPKEARISQQVAAVECIETGGELGALLTESNLVKLYQPLHNRTLQRKVSLVVTRRVLDSEGYYRTETSEMTEIGMDVATDVLGVFTTRGAAKRFMIEIAHNFYLCPKLMGFEKGKGRCFRQQLDRCFGACSLDEPALTYNARFDQAFINTSVDEWPFDGPVEVVEESGNLTEIIKIYRWCVTERQVGGETQQSEGKVFDLDTYRIIRSYFRSGKATIGPVTS